MKSGKRARLIGQPVDTSGPRRSLPNTLGQKSVAPLPAMNKDYVGSDFDDFLREERIFEEVEAGALKKVAGWLKENAEAIESSNAYVEKHGLPLEKYRMF